MNKIWIMRGDASVEASILTKDFAIKSVAEEFGCGLAEIAVIGDGANDLPMLTMDGIGLRGAPANAEQKVKDILSTLDNSYVSDQPVGDGFFDIYQRAAEMRIKVVVTDRDGVLKKGAQVQWGPRFAELAMEMGGKMPYVIVLTAASHEQNLKFMEEYGIDTRLASNPHVVQHPYLMLAEGGAIHINVLNGRTKNFAGIIDPELLAKMKGQFEREVKEYIGARLDSMGLGWSEDYDDQRGKVYHVVNKRCMVCFNIPREFPDGRKGYRDSSDADELRNIMVEAMMTVADRLGIERAAF